MQIRYVCATKFIVAYEPIFHTSGASGVDLRADIPEHFDLAPRQTTTISTGMGFEIPSGFEGQVRSRSGLASKAGIFMLNAPGTIDADFRGVVSVVVANFSDCTFRINPNDRIAQFVISPVPTVEYVAVSTLDFTSRGEQGFGSTGI